VDRRNFIKTGILTAGVAVIGSSIAVDAVTKTNGKQKLPVYGPDIKTSLGKKHTPFIRAPKKVKAGQWFDVYVEVGHYMARPNKRVHWIEHVALWVDSRDVVMARFQATKSAPKTTFSIKIDKPGKAVLRGFGYSQIIHQNRDFHRPSGSKSRPAALERPSLAATTASFALV